MADRVTTRGRLEELRGATDEELTATIAIARRAIYQFRRDRMSKPIENVKAVHRNRKEIARALTIMRERELAQAKES